jgi:transposase InsO family protein
VPEYEGDGIGRAIYRRAHTSLPAAGAHGYPYLLRGCEVGSPDEVWCANVTDNPMAGGFAYLVAVMDWKTRTVLSWKLSNTLDGIPSGALREALVGAGRAPEIFNTDQGSHFTSRAWIDERITRAQQLIRETSRSLIEVALEVGYRSPSHFAKDFRRVTDATPTEFCNGL